MKHTRKSELVLMESTHSYFLDGQEILGNSDIRRLAGISDYSKVNLEVMERAQAFGRVVHKVCELWDRCILDESSVDPLIVPYFEAWKKFCEDRVKSWLLIEQKLFAPVDNLWVAGTIDRIFTGESGVELLDIKSAGGNKKEHRIQTAGYQYKYEWLFRQKISKRGVVELRADGTYEQFEHCDQSDISVFKNAVPVAYFNSTKK